ncbi:ependymin-like 1 [Brienomyrus brachyistius]|uniref:ependymin-like 1 n=1 Tax=Brienomyrus brachyistius TaxID=42636 RepID=UPI0020B33B62|nr:ependymin-like 1 [Brienomyrus brachyistius]
MQTLALVSITLCLAVNVWAQKPRHCRSPPLVVGSLTVSAREGEFFAEAKYSYDALLKRVRLREFGCNSSQAFHTDKLILFRKRVMYDISYHNHSCKRVPLRVHFHPMEVPREAQLLSEVVLGSSSAPGQGLLVNIWVGNVSETGGKYFSTFTEFGCLPVSSIYYSNSTGWVITSFFNNMYGIGNPEDFIPPDFCMQKENEETEWGTERDFFEALF